MTYEELIALMDEKEVGDPSVVEILDASVEGFRDDLEDMKPETALYMAGIASFYRDSVGAYELLQRALPIIDKPGKLPRMYEQQLKVWRSRKDKSQHDLEYLSIYLGIKDRRRPEQEGMPDLDGEGEDEPPADQAVAALLRGLLGDSDNKE